MTKFSLCQREMQN